MTVAPPAGPALQFLAAAEGLSVADADGFARRLAAWRPGTKASRLLAASSDTGGAIDLMVLFGIADAAGFDPEQLWQWGRNRRNRLRVPVGRYIDSGRTWFIDLKEDDEANGPHIGLGGATGSGKSEFLRTLVLALCMTHSPDDLVIVPADFKGNKTFAGLERLPHVLVVLHNLDGSPDRIARLRQVFQGELIHRQKLLDSLGELAKDAVEYRALRRKRPDLGLEPMPALLIPFDELMQAQREAPELITIMNIVGTVGRSLDVHMMPVSQTFDPSMMQGIDPHLRARIALKMNKPEDYRPILGGSFHAPALPDRKGVGYFVDSLTSSSAPSRVETCYVSKRYVPPDLAASEAQQRAQRDHFKPVLLSCFPDPAAAAIEGRYAIDERSTPPADDDADDTDDAAPAGAAVDDGEDEDGEQQQVGPTVMSTVIDVLEGHGQTPRQIWLEELVSYKPVDTFTQRYVDERPAPAVGDLVAPCGLIDKPRIHQQHVLEVGLGQNVAIVGRSDSGKSTALAALIMSAAWLYPPDRVQFYCMDASGGGLAQLAQLDHVGDVVVGTGDTYGVQRLVNHIRHVLRNREASWAPAGVYDVDTWRRRRFGGEAGPLPADDGYGDVFFVVDGADSFTKEFDEHADTLLALADRGPKYGVHVIVSARSWGVGRMHKFWDFITHWYELKLTDSGESKMGRDSADSVPGDIPGRGLISASGTQAARRDSITAKVTNLKSIPPDPAFHILFADPSLTGPVGQRVRGDAACGLLNGRWLRARPAPAIPALPRLVQLSALPPAPDSSLVLGQRESDLSTQLWQPRRDSHLVVLGEAQCGKSTALATVGHQLQRRIDDPIGKYPPVVVVFDLRSSLLGVVGSAAHYVYSEPQVAAAVGHVDELLASRDTDELLTQQELLEQRQRGVTFEGPEIFVLIDNYTDFLAGYEDPFARWEKAAARGGGIGFHLIVSRVADQAAFAAPRGLFAALRSTAAPVLLMSADPSLSNLVGKARGQKLPQGRGLYITRDEQMMVQAAHL